MNLVLHQFRKDLRQFRAPVLGWGALLVLDLVVNMNWVAPVDWRVVEHQEFLPTLLRASLVSLLWVAVFLLPAVVVLADSPARFDGFLSTRPMPKRDLYLAKALFLGLLVVVPAVVQEAIYLTLQGLTPQLVLRGTFERLLFLAPLVTLAGVFGAMWRDVKEFGVAGVAVTTGVWLMLLALMVVTEQIGDRRWRQDDPTAIAVLFQLCFLAAAVGLLVWLNTWRRWGKLVRAFALAAAGLVSYGVGLLAPTELPPPRPEEPSPDWAQLKTAPLELSARRLSVGSVSQSPLASSRRLDIRVGLQLASQPEGVVIDWHSRHSALRWTNAVRYADPEAGWRWEFTALYGEPPMEDIQAMAGILPPDTIFIARGFAPNERNVTRLGVFSFEVDGAGLNEAAKITAALQGDVFRWEQEADLPLVPGSRATERSGAWRLAHVSGAEDRHRALQVILERRQFALFTSRDLMTQRSRFWPNHLYEFVLYDPQQRVARFVDFRSHPQARYAEHTSFTRSFLNLEFGSDTTFPPISAREQASARLLIFRRHYLGSVLKRWASPSVTLAGFLADGGASGAVQGDRLSRGEFTRRLATLRPPPPEARRAVVGAYAHELLRLVEARHYHPADDDPVVYRLAALVPGHLDMFFDAMGVAGTYGRIALRKALRFGVVEEQKPQIIAALDRQPDLAEIVLDRGWLEEARPVLYRLLEGLRRLDDDAVTAIAWFEDPETYPNLADLFELEPKLELYERLRTLPGMEPHLDRAVTRAWNRRHRVLSPTQQASPVLSVALRHGRADALREAFRILRVLPEDRREHFSTQLLDAFRDNLICPDLPRNETYDDRRYAAWLVKHQADDFQYDLVRRRFVLKASTAKTMDPSRPAIARATAS